MKRIGMIAGAAMLALAGCGSDKAPAPGESGTVPAQVVGGSGKGPVGWNAADACSILDKSELGSILRRTVTDTQLDLVSEAGQTSAATSQCTYKFADGGEATLTARWSPINDNTVEAIAAARAAATASVKAFTSRPIEDIPLGKSAFLVPGINQLHVFLDDARMMVISPGNIPDADAKMMLIGLATRAGAS